MPTLNLSPACSVQMTSSSCLRAVALCCLVARAPYGPHTYVTCYPDLLAPRLLLSTHRFGASSHTRLSSKLTPSLSHASSVQQTATTQPHPHHPRLVQASSSSQTAAAQLPEPVASRPWSQRLGGLSANITTLVDTVTRTQPQQTSQQQPQPASSKPEGVSAALRGLFQRQSIGGLGAPRNSNAAAAPKPPATATAEQPASQPAAEPQYAAPTGQSMSAAQAGSRGQSEAGDETTAAAAPSAPPALPSQPAADAPARPASAGVSGSSAAGTSLPDMPTPGSSAPDPVRTQQHAESHASPAQQRSVPAGTLQRLRQGEQQWRTQMVLNSEGGITGLALCMLGGDAQAVCVGQGGAMRCISLASGAQVSSGSAPLV